MKRVERQENFMMTGIFWFARGLCIYAGRLQTHRLAIFLLNPVCCLFLLAITVVYAAPTLSASCFRPSPWSNGPRCLAIARARFSICKSTAVCSSSSRFVLLITRTPGHWCCNRGRNSTFRSLFTRQGEVKAVRRTKTNAIERQYRICCFKCDLFVGFSLQPFDSIADVHQLYVVDGSTSLIRSSLLDDSSEDASPILATTSSSSSSTSTSTSSSSLFSLHASPPAASEPNYESAHTASPSCSSASSGTAAASASATPATEPCEKSSAAPLEEDPHSAHVDSAGANEATTAPQ